jgi:hypothetical protein
MGYEDQGGQLNSPSPSTASMITGAMVRLIGVCLLVAGLVLAALVMLEAWALYKNPDRIQDFAAAVERGSNIDKTLAPRRSGEGLASLSLGQSEDPGAISIRLSYFFAWFIVFILMLLLSRIAITAVSTGGKLALYDLEVKRLAKALIHETSKAYK